MLTALCLTTLDFGIRLVPEGLAVREPGPPVARQNIIQIAVTFPRVALASEVVGHESVLAFPQC